MHRLWALGYFLAIFSSQAFAIEFVDGQSGPPTQRNGMHSCPPGFAVTGVHVGNNWLLCEGDWSVQLVAPPVGLANEAGDSGVRTDNQTPTAGPCIGAAAIEL
jgi:hypothetical protein